MMETLSYLCETCGVEYAPSTNPPGRCPICEDERQYVPSGGQLWTTMDRVRRKHRNVVEKISENLYALYSVPSFAIGQRAHLIISPGGNVLWDCISNLDESTVDLIRRLGGLKAICISHPHYFATLARWSAAFDHAPVYIHALDQDWLGRRPEKLRLWAGESHELWDGMQLVCCGGHFPGGHVLYWPSEKALLTGDVIQVCPDLKSVSFMYSYPNLIPLPQKAIQRISACMEPLDYDAMYGAFGRYIHRGAKQVMAHSVKRYLSIFE